MALAIQQLDLQTCIPYEYLFITSSKRGYASGLNYHSHIHTHLHTQKDLKLASKISLPILFTYMQKLLLFQVHIHILINQHAYILLRGTYSFPNKKDDLMCYSSKEQGAVRRQSCYV